jgi:aminomethyltransferase
MNLYGNDMDETRHPLESGLAWTVAFEPEDRDFIGREALVTARASGGDRLFGLMLEERGVLRSHQLVSAAADSAADDHAPGYGAPGERAPGYGSPGAPLGEVTSGTFSPTLNRAIALARLKPQPGTRVWVDIRGKPHAARVVKPPFVRNGKPLVEIQ